MLDADTIREVVKSICLKILGSTRINEEAKFGFTKLT